MKFSKQTQASFIRAWADQKRATWSDGNVTYLESLFEFFVFLSSRFGKDWVNFSNPDKPANSPYSGDSTIFEIGCYVYSMVGLWLTRNKPELMNKLCEYIKQRFIDLFSEALTIENVQELFIERVEKYDELIRKEKTQLLAVYLQELVKRTKNNTPPQKAKFDNIKISVNSDDDISLAALFAVYARDKVPLIYEMLEKFVSATEKEKPENPLFGCLGIIILFGLMFGVVAFLTYLAHLD